MSPNLSKKVIDEKILVVILRDGVDCIEKRLEKIRNKNKGAAILVNTPETEKTVDFIYNLVAQDVAAFITA